MAAAAILGLLVGLPSRRLIGDYLAIVTLFFGEAFVEFTNNVAPSKLGGPNGIVGIDPIRSSGSSSRPTRATYYLLLVVVLLDDERDAAARSDRAPAGAGGRSARIRWPRHR